MPATLGKPIPDANLLSEALQELMVIPRTPSPDPVEEEIGNLSQQDILELARRQLRRDRVRSTT